MDRQLVPVAARPAVDGHVWLAVKAADVTVDSDTDTDLL
jgi:hypothetical protein